MHYHVDVFAGPKGRFVRGFTLLSDGDGWVVCDEIGLLGPPRNISERLPLSAALQTALETLHGLVEKPMTPVWGGTPYDVLGYEQPSLLQRLLRRKTTHKTTVGEDGLPVVIE